MKIMHRIFQFICLAIIFITTSTLFASQQLIIEPDAGREPLLTAIQKAKSSIDLVMYGFTDLTFTQALIQAKKSGKNVQVLLEPEPYRAANENAFSIKHLQTANIAIKWPSQNFQLTHQKTLLIDQRYAIVMTFNLTHSTFKNQRNFALIIDDPATIKEIYAVYHADCLHENITVNQPSLIWSPDNSQEKILQFIRSAHSDIKIYAQGVSDYQTIGALARAARTGKSVKILTSKKGDGSTKKMDFLRKAGVDIHFSRKYIIHAKVIIVDNERAILGSINLTTPSLNKNRELAVITQDTQVVKGLLKTFDKDWEESFSEKSKNKQTKQEGFKEIKYMTRLISRLLREAF